MNNRIYKSQCQHGSNFTLKRVVRRNQPPTPYHSLRIRVANSIDHGCRRTNRPLECIVRASASVDDTDDQTPATSPLPPPDQLVIVDEFLDPSEAKRLRRAFTDRFHNPRDTSSDRFVWDYWYVPGQYSLHRTPASSFFPSRMYQVIEEALLTYGQETLGCRALSPIWLSYYVDGSEQKLHTDPWQGAFAFVWSLTDWEARKFIGGETEIMRPAILDYWRTFEPRRGLETKDLFEHVEAKFNRLVVFDPRIPHGVRRVEGVKNPAEGRIVLHGWFTQPEPYYTGALDAEAAQETLLEAQTELLDELGQLPQVTGVLTVALHIAASGRVETIDFLVDTLIVHPSFIANDAEQTVDEIRRDVRGTIVEIMGQVNFPSAGGESRIILPLIFE